MCVSYHVGAVEPLEQRRGDAKVLHDRADRGREEVGVRTDGLHHAHLHLRAAHGGAGRRQGQASCDVLCGLCVSVVVVGRSARRDRPSPAREGPMEKKKVHMCGIPVPPRPCTTHAVADTTDTPVPGVCRKAVAPTAMPARTVATSCTRMVADRSVGIWVVRGDGCVYT